MSTYGDGNENTFFSILNVGLFVLLNYLITTFVICALASLICIFHYYSLKIFQEQLYSQGISVQEAIKEHIVLMRLQNESAKYLQYIIFPPLILYTTGALLSAYNMLSTQVYTNLSATIFQLILAFVTLMVRKHDQTTSNMIVSNSPLIDLSYSLALFLLRFRFCLSLFFCFKIPLVSGAQITSICRDLARLATNMDLTENLLERQALIQQLVLLPGNAFFIFGLEISHSLLAKISYLILAGTIIVARGASISPN